MIALDPTATAEFSLETDRAKPESARPVFISRILTARAHTQVVALLEDAGNLQQTDEGLAKLTEAVTRMLAGWRNIPGEFTAEMAKESLPDMLTTNELWELAYGLISASRLAEADRKNSASQSASATGSSATGAGQATATPPKPQG